MDAVKCFSAQLPPVEPSAAIGGAIAAAREFAASCSLVPASGARLVVVVDELVGNLIRHGDVQDSDLRIDLALAHRDGDVVVTLEDNCLPFDLRDATFAGPDPDSGGGVGLALVRAWAEIVSYGHANGVNRLVLRLPAETTG